MHARKLARMSWRLAGGGIALLFIAAGPHRPLPLPCQTMTLPEVAGAPISIADLNHLRLSVWFLPGGGDMVEIRDHIISKADLRVTNDSPTQSWKGALRDGDRARIDLALASLPCKAGNEEYVMPNVFDGIGIVLEIETKAGCKRTIRLQNTYVEQVAELGRALNLALPEASRVRESVWAKCERR
jgi:hypothetical protein